MANKPHKVRAFRLITKKYLKNKLIDNDSFDKEILDYWLYAIKLLRTNSKILRYESQDGNGSKQFYLHEILEDNNEYLFGRFKTGLYGIEQDFKNVHTKRVIYKRKKNNTTDDDVYFYLYYNTGVLLVGNDPNSAINVKSLNEYFKMLEYLCEPYRTEFNRVNVMDLQIYKGQMISVNSLPPQEFFEELVKMRKIKSASFTISDEDASDSINVNHHLKSLDNDFNVKSNEVEIEIKITNKSSKNLVKDIEGLFKIMNLSESFDDLKVVGDHQDGGVRTLKENLPIRNFDIVLDYGEKNYPINFAEVKTKLIELNSEKKLLFSKVSKSKSQFLGDDIAVKEKIKALSIQRNKDCSLLKECDKIFKYKHPWGQIKENS